MGAECQPSYLVKAEITGTDSLVARMRRELAQFSPELRTFVEQLLKRNPLSRLTAKRALHHDFLRNRDDAGWDLTVQHAMDNVLNADAATFRAVYEESKPNLHFHFRDADAAFECYSQYCAQAQLRGQRALTPREFLKEMEGLFTAPIRTSQGVGRLEYLGQKSAWRGVLRHKQDQAVTAGYANAYPSHMEVTEVVYVGQQAQ
ncbi:hypothetical protein AAVH_21138 [Aphelenchoides avenae]|nr:hypothetical protein AAVH_21138 [Aphelenchus avenae]